MTSSVWRGALILTGAAIAVKIMSVLYRIPYQNIAGDLGFYVYQQIYPFFAGAVFLAAYGFPAAISKLVAVRLAERRTGGAEEVFVRSFLVLAVFSGAVFVLLFGGAPWISNVMGDSRLAGPLKTVAFSFLFIPPIAVIRGFFQGNDQMSPTAVSQLFEQSVRAALIIGLTVYVVFHGMGPYSAGMAAGIGSSAGMAAASVVLIVYAFRNRVLFCQKGEVISFAAMVKVLTVDGLAFSVSSLGLVLFLLIDTFTVVPLLGTSLSEARVQMGVYDRGYPVVQLATAAAISFTLAFVPEMARAHARGDREFVREKSRLAIRLCFAFGAAGVTGLALIVRPFNIMLFQDASGSQTLALFGVTMLFSMIAMTTAGLLQALGETRRTFYHTWIGLILKGALNFILIPAFGIFGAATATVLAFAVIAGLNGLTLHKRTEAFFALSGSGRKLLAALLLMAGVVAIWQYGWASLFPGLESRLFASIKALGAVVAGAVAYLLALLRLGFFSKTELAAFSKGEKTKRSA
ncbi:MAG TPA: polysaccharide biosynthesis protein [Bacillales bacterium]|nr:polysaccharide biosynthesis protein [Bacillales bacterium]